MADVTAVPGDLVPSRVGGASRALRAAALLALASGVLGGCAGGTDDAAPTPTVATPGVVSAPQLTGDVAFPRTLQADRWVEVQLSGEQATGWLVTSATLTSGAFAPLDATHANVRFFAHHVARVRVPLGAPQCPVMPGPTSVEITLASPEGALATASVPLPSELLESINADECEVEAVREAAAPALGEPLAREATTVSTTLTLTRGSLDATAGASLADARGSVIFTLRPAQGAAFPLTLAPGEREASMPVEIEATRCDQHAFAESKKTFVFATWVSLGGDEPRYVELAPSPDLKDALQAAFDACGDDSTRDAPGGG